MWFALLTVIACASEPTQEPPPAEEQAVEHKARKQISRDYAQKLCFRNDAQHAETLIWKRLERWPPAVEYTIPTSDQLTPELTATWLDKAQEDIGIRSYMDWFGAAAYFQAANLHGLAGPACDRGIAVANGAQP